MADVLPGAVAVPRLEAERVVLRASHEDDLEALWAIFSDPEAMRYWATPPHTRLEQTRAVLDRDAAGFAARTALTWIVERREDGALLGRVALVPEAWQGRAEVGYILSRAFWGQGYAGEALRRLLDFAFGDLGLRRLEADIDPRNEGSLRSAERLGFAREGLLRERWSVGGEVADSVMLGLLAREWAARGR